MNGEPSHSVFGLRVRHLGRGHVGVRAHQVHAAALQLEVVFGKDRERLGQRREAGDELGPSRPNRSTSNSTVSLDMPFPGAETLVTVASADR